MRFTFIEQIICVILFAVANASHFKIKGLECVQVDPSFCYFEYCVLKPISRDVQEISITVKMLQLPVTNITVGGDIKRRFKPPFYKFKVDGCTFFRAKRRNLIANGIYKFLGLDVYSNMNHSCPFDHDLIIDHMRLGDISNLPLPIGSEDYVITSKWYVYNVLRAELNIIFNISN